MTAFFKTSDKQALTPLVTASLHTPSVDRPGAGFMTVLLSSETVT